MDAPKRSEAARQSRPVDTSIAAENLTHNAEEVNAEAERKRRIFEALGHYLRHGHSTFRARQIQVEGAALRKGRKR